jgi:hypothetical protein
MIRGMVTRGLLFVPKPRLLVPNSLSSRGEVATVKWSQISQCKKEIDPIFLDCAPKGAQA